MRGASHINKCADEANSIARVASGIAHFLLMEVLMPQRVGKPYQCSGKWRIRPIIDRKRVCLTFDTLSDAEAALAVINVNKAMSKRSRCVLCGAEKKYDVEDKYGLVEG